MLNCSQNHREYRGSLYTHKNAEPKLTGGSTKIEKGAKMGHFPKRGWF
jgi:hypothetical protein